METIPPLSSVRIGFTDWMKKQLLIALALGLDKTFITISSDIIESLYGLAKQHVTNEIKDANRIALRILAHCGELTKTDAQNVLKISAFDTEEIVGSRPRRSNNAERFYPIPVVLTKLMLMIKNKIW